jgi:hypothetical protein
MANVLPSVLTAGAILRDKESAWEPSAFRRTLNVAPGLGYACLGGQFWLLLPDNTLYEFWWLEANSSDRIEGESWPEYAYRSCAEVLSRFNVLVNESDFKEEAKQFESLVARDDWERSNFRLLFNAYFVSQHELNSLELRATS